MIFRNVTTGRFQKSQENAVPIREYRDSDTGRFITRERWEQLSQHREEELDQFDDWDDLGDFDELGEEQTYDDES